MQNLGLKLKLFAADGLNARGKDLIVPVEDYWVLTSTLVAAFSSGASQNFGFAMTPLQYLEETLRINVVPSNNLGDGAGQLKTWMISSEAIQNPNQHPTYGLMHVDEGSLLLRLRWLKLHRSTNCPGACFALLRGGFLPSRFMDDSKLVGIVILLKS